MESIVLLLAKSFYIHLGAMGTIHMDVGYAGVQDIVVLHHDICGMPTNKNPAIVQNRRALDDH